MVESKEYPEIKRLQGKILVPCDVEQVEREGEKFYRYTLLRLENRGQDINDPFFRQKHYAELRREYILQQQPLWEQLEAIAEFLETLGSDQLNETAARVVETKARVRKLFPK